MKRKDFIMMVIWLICLLSIVAIIDGMVEIIAEETSKRTIELLKKEKPCQAE
jgi:putative exporter of polyketide antibiotics